MMMCDDYQSLIIIINVDFINFEVIADIFFML